MLERAVFYARVSTDEEAQLNAIELQIDENRDVIKSQGWELVDEYIDRSRSGTKVKGRDEYQRLLDDIELDKFDIIVAKDQDRLQRNTRDWYIFVDALAKNGKRLYLYLENRFFTPSEDALITGIKAILAEEYSRGLSKKLHNFNDRQREKARNGDTSILLQGVANTFGWTKVNGEVVLEPSEAKYRKLMCELTLQGKGSTEVAMIVNNMGSRNRNGNPWRASDIARMVYDEKNVGTFVLGRIRQNFETKGIIHTDPSEWVYLENAIPPIITQDEYERLQKIKAQRTTGRGKMRGIKAGASPEFSGKIVCGCCGGTYWRRVDRTTGEEYWVCSTKTKNGRKTRMVTSVTGKKGDYNPCGCDNRNIYTKELRRLITEGAEMLIADRKEVKAYYEEWLKNLRAKLIQGEATYTEADLKKELARKSRLQDALLDGVFTKEEYAIKAKKIEESIEEIRADLKRSDTALEDVREIDKLLSDMDKTIGEFLGLKENEGFDVTYLLKSIDKIVVEPDTVDLVMPCLSFDIRKRKIEKSTVCTNRQRLFRWGVSDPAASWSPP